jgi:hypothetical protein
MHRVWTNLLTSGYLTINDRILESIHLQCFRNVDTIRLAGRICALYIRTMISCYTSFYVQPFDCGGASLRLQLYSCRRETNEA